MHATPSSLLRGGYFGKMHATLLSVWALFPRSMDSALPGIAIQAVMTARSVSRLIFMTANTAFFRFAHSKIQNPVSTKRCGNALFATKPSGLCEVAI
jgi:hypothetical protein